MSLINKMLQDLDARGSQGGGGPTDIRPVGRGERGVPLPVVVGALAGVLMLAVGGVYGWRIFMGGDAVAPPAAALVAAPVAQQAVISPPEQLPMPEAAPRAAVVPAPSAATQPAAAERATAAPERATATAPERTTAARERDTTAAPERATAAREWDTAAAPERATVGVREKAVQASAPPGVARARGVAVPPVAASVAGAPQGGRQAPTGQGGEGAYRRALAGLQEGRMVEAVAQLEQALAIDPRHEAARQTLVGILIEAGRADEAMRLMQAGLALDPRQPAMAMLLARMQIDGGGSGVETLMKSLPATVGNGEYRAFLAGALQRERRYPEAVEQYQAALRGAPENGVWWMGLGMALEADKRLPEALAAFQRAGAAGNLSPELQGFVERRVGALGR